MKNSTKKTVRKVYMTLSGMCYSIEAAQNLYGAALENATLAKVILDKNGNVIGSWE